jgi:CotH kinase protein/Lamin Tail Domain/Chitobiase/beta-hexosaminidase C-terminal domain
MRQNPITHFLQRSLASVALIALIPAVGRAAPIINEFLTSNTTGLQDEDLTRGDWIELHNPDAAAVNLVGFYLTDTATALTRWQFPAVTLPAGGYLVVFASGKNRAVAGAPLHTNFSLTSGGEYLALVAADGTTLVHEYAPTFPAQTADISYGLLTPSPTAEKAYFTIPTPGAVNQALNASAPPVVFSLSSRTFAQNGSLLLTLSTPVPTATIRYTLDRTEPTAASTLYVGPITVNYSVRVRAKSFLAGRPDGPTRSESYLTLDAAAQAFTSNLPIMIQHSWGSGHPSATVLTGTQPEDTKHAVWFVFEPKAPDNLARMTNLPDLATPSYFERRGSSTFDAVKYSMTMGALDETGVGRDVAPLGYSSNDDFVLNAPYQFDRTLIHNDLIYRLSNEIGRYAVRTRHVEVFQSVNNDIAASGPIPAYGVVTGATIGTDYYGVYSFQDKISRGNNRVDIEKLEPTDSTLPNVQGGYIFKIDRLDLGDVGVTGGGRAWPLVQPKEFTSYPTHLPVATAQQKTYLAGVINAMYSALQSPNFAHPTLGYRAHLDVPAAIDHHILSTIPKSADAFRLSGYWHKSRYGKLVMGPIFDFDRAQGSTDGRDLNPNTWRGDTGDLGTDFFHNSAVHTPNYFHWMFQDPKFWQEWIDRFHEIRQTVFSTAHVNAIIDEYTELLDPANGATTPAKRNLLKFTATPARAAGATTPGTNGTFRGEIAFLKSWWQSRLAFVDGQFTRPAEPSVAAGPVAVGTMLTLTSPSTPRPGVAILYTTDGTEPGVSGRAFSVPLVTESTPVKAMVPTVDPGSFAWRGLGYDDSAWAASTPGPGPHGVGFDDAIIAPGTDFTPYFVNGIRLNTATFPSPGMPTMRSVNASCYVRYNFTVTPEQVENISALKLAVRYDDGFEVYLNGVRLADRNKPAVFAWNSASSSAPADPAAIIYEEIELPASALVAGANVLSFQLLNLFSSQVDALLQATLTGGSVNLTGTTKLYRAPLTLNQPSQFLVRTYDPATPTDPPTSGAGGVGIVPVGSSWSAPTRLTYFPGATAATAANLVISEVHYHPLPPNATEIAAGATLDNDFEFIRLTNTSNAPIDLTGIHFTNGVSFTAAAGLRNWLPAGASVVIVENPVGYALRNIGGPTVFGTYEGELDDGGDHLVLNAKDGSIIADLQYDDKAPWPTLADEGYSLVYQSGTYSTPTSWQSSRDPGGQGITSFAGFQARYFDLTAPGTPLGQRTASADPDGDGLSNFMEYAVGSHPLDARSAPRPTVSPEGQFFLLTRRVGAADVRYVFQIGDDLAGWAPQGTPTVLAIPGENTV